MEVYDLQEAMTEKSYDPPPLQINSMQWIINLLQFNTISWLIGAGFSLFKA